MAVVHWRHDELAAARRCYAQTRIYDSAQVKTRLSEVPVERDYYVEPLQNGPFNPLLLGPGSSHYINITTATSRLLVEFKINVK